MCSICFCFAENALHVCIDGGIGVGSKRGQFANNHLVTFEPGASNLPGTGFLRLKVQAKQSLIFLSRSRWFDMHKFPSYLIGPGEPPYESLQGGGAPG